MERYESKKVRSEEFRDLVKSLVSDSYYWLIEECGTFLSFVGDKELNKIKMHRGNFCKHRFCPMCAWRKARKDALELSLMMQDIKISYDKAFIFLTLTTPNVVAERLGDEIKRYNKSFDKLFKRKVVKRVVKGYVRKLEITYNEKRDDYHPHFHVLIVVNKSYFTDVKAYLNQKEWLRLWREATGISEITQVDVRRVKEQNSNELYEMAKYTGKDSDYLSNEKVFKVFYESLKGKRAFAYGGLFKEVRKKLKNGDLDYLKEIDPTKYIYQIFCGWNQMHYYASELRLMSEEMQKEVNHQMINELDDKYL
ncbi:TPA: protein rep [Staphylococcus aureus]|uniref:protein rep n=12 Tax=Staphylococcus TaxID=1279 RepID=UPI00077A471B|nr:protein rep [Staphylococcus aureus]HCY5823859.1 protein rep [Staphylococcus aureus]HCY8811094.1 protein rep [Staphylococcus aureus]HCZ0235135.1 protein rep [Staphylococcus aureus]HDA1970249.1 protein rep [Staphylococcus aureus]HDA1989116.1 protein rep [Staphylococcus aureus]